ncbi:Uncharacterised protein [Bordetella pertussis]|nr:Uncharacterised protein [Bordetella pertussis]
MRGHRVAGHRAIIVGWLAMAGRRVTGVVVGRGRVVAGRVVHRAVVGAGRVTAGGGVGDAAGAVLRGRRVAGLRTDGEVGAGRHQRQRAGDPPAIG